MKFCVIGCLVCSMLFGQILYEEHFTGGVMQLDWNPWFAYTGIYDSMQVISDPTTPELDGWAGKITNELAGAGPGITYAGTDDLDDYSIEAWIYTTVTPPMPPMPGPYNGITMRMDSVNHYYYRLISDFDSNGRLRLGVFTGGAAADSIRDWASGEIPGGVPATSSWHKFKLKMIADSIWAYYDDVLLPDCPFIDNSIAQGFFGVLVFNMMAIDSTKCDGIVVAGPVGINEHDSGKIGAFAIYPNPFRHSTNIRFAIHDAGHATTEVTLRIFDATGRMVRDLRLLPNALRNTLSWDGRDASGNALAPGVYFIAENYSNTIEKVVKLK